MSLINQVLKEVESRRAAERGARAPITPALRMPAKSPPVRHLAAVAALFAVAGLAVGFWYLWPTDVSAPVRSPSTPLSPVATASPPDRPGGKTTTAPAVVPAPTPPAKPVARAPAAPPEPEVRPRPTPTAPESTSAAVAKPPVPAPVVEAPPTQTAPVIEKRARPASPRQQADRLHDRGYRLLTAGQRDAAEARFTEALETYPAHQGAREALAGLLASEGRWVELLPVAEEGLLHHPESAMLAQLAARAHLQQGDSSAAIEVLEGSLAAASGNSVIAAFLAATYQQVGNFAASADLYRRLVTMQPQNGVWWAGLGLALERTGRVEEAVAAFEKALARGGLKAELRRYLEQRVAAKR